MNYSLGNMLSRGGALNPDGLALDLQFAADKTLTARRGPTPTFTRASTATFVGSNGLIQTAAINTPRFDHDPVTLASRGLLIEDSRTNQILHSQNFANAAWIAAGTGATKIGTSSLADPQGLFNAYEINVGNVGGSNPSNIRQTISPTLTTAQRTLSIYVRTASGTSVFRLQVWTGSIEITSVNFTATTTWTRFDFVINNAFSEFKITAGSAGGSVSNIHVWGAQLEVGSFPTSFIPTTTASVVRSADVCSITGWDFSGFYNQSEGSLLVNAFTPANGDRTIVATDDNTANEMVRLRTEGTNPFFKVTDGGVDVVAIDSGTVSANTTFKLAGAYKLNDFASSVNGGSAVTDTSGTIPTVDRMRIGSGQAGNTMCGCVSSLRYYQKRVSDAKLQSLTS